MHNILGEEAEAFFNALQTEAPVSVRIHPVKGKELFTGKPRVAWCKSGRLLSERPVFTLDPYFHAGCYYVQEAGSMLIESLLSESGKKQGSPLVLDLCAAPGGKSTHLQSILPENSILVSNEIIPGRNRILRHNLSKWGYPHTIIIQNETHEIARSGMCFDLILIDAPCSGEGLFRKDPGAIGEWSMQQVEKCVLRQRSILEDSLPLFAEGALLIYSTCTYEPAENDQQIEYLIKNHPFKVVTPQAPEGIVPTKYGWQAFPHKTASEGFYCCLLQYEGKNPPPKNTLFRKEAKPSITSSEWLTHANNFELHYHEEYINAATPALIQAMNNLKKTCYIRQYGIPMGMQKGKDFIPSPELALSLELNTVLPTIELEKNDAISYLRCDPIIKPASQRGWHLVNYKGKPLGWAKNIQQRWNNYFPKEWRILMDNKPE